MLLAFFLGFRWIKESEFGRFFVLFYFVFVSLSVNLDYKLIYFVDGIGLFFLTSSTSEIRYGLL